MSKVMPISQGTARETGMYDFSTYLVWCHGKDVLSVRGGKEVCHVCHGSIVEGDAADEGGACGGRDVELQGKKREKYSI